MHFAIKFFFFQFVTLSIPFDRFWIFRCCCCCLFKFFAPFHGNELFDWKWFVEILLHTLWSICRCRAYWTGSGHNEMGFQHCAALFSLSIFRCFFFFSLTLQIIGLLCHYFFFIISHTVSPQFYEYGFSLSLVWIGFECVSVCMHAVTRNTFNGAKTIFNVSRSINAHIRKLCASALAVRYSL